MCSGIEVFGGGLPCDCGTREVGKLILWPERRIKSLNKHLQPI